MPLLGTQVLCTTQHALHADPPDLRFEHTLCPGERVSPCQVLETRPFSTRVCSVWGPLRSPLLMSSQEPGLPERRHRHSWCTSLRSPCAHFVCDRARVLGPAAVSYRPPRARVTWGQKEAWGVAQSWPSVRTSVTLRIGGVCPCAPGGRHRAWCVPTGLTSPSPGRMVTSTRPCDSLKSSVFARTVAFGDPKVKTWVICFVSMFEGKT